MPQRQLNSHFPELRKTVHEALTWLQQNPPGHSPLHHLSIYQQTLQQTKEPYEATKIIVQQACQKLEANEAELLHLRFVERLTMREVISKINLSESGANKKQSRAIDKLTQMLRQMELDTQHHKALLRLEQRLPLPPAAQLIGVSDLLSELSACVTALNPLVWLMVLKGLGGIGKTALANAIVRQAALNGRFHGLAWVSAKQQEFLPALGLQTIAQPALNISRLTDSLLTQLADEASRTVAPQNRFPALMKLLKEKPYLIVIDNLETVVDYEHLIPELRRLVNPTMILLTSREMGAYEDVAQFKLHELSRADSYALLKHEAHQRRLSALLEAHEPQLAAIYEVVGGNPLALKLIVGQLQALPLARILESLQQLRGRKAEDLFTFIYWQAWRGLDDSCQKTLLIMPLVQQGCFDQLLTASQLSSTDLGEAIERLISLSLLERSGDVDEPRYSIHRLTETFLLTEIAKWQSNLGRIDPV